MENTLDIVQLIDKNPITRLTKNYENKFIEKIRKNFTESQQHLFVSSFYTYLNYSKDEYIIDLDNVWKWLGFERKGFCKKTLEKHFVVDIDYKIFTKKQFCKKAASPVGEAPRENVIKTTSPVREVPQDNVLEDLGGAGLNKEIILLKINTFKKLCLKSNTKKADEIHDYFIKMEETLNEVVDEESSELRLQLQNTHNELEEKDKLLQIQIDKTKIEVLLAKERVLIDTHRKTNVFYICLFEYKCKWYVKFGISEGSINISYDILKRINYT